MKHIKNLDLCGSRGSESFVGPLFILTHYVVNMHNLVFCIQSSSSTDSLSECQMVIGGHMPLVKKSSVQLKDEQISTLKVIIVGEPHTGKTSLLKSYIYKDFCFAYEETVSFNYK